jgi:hypothetical protein
MTRAITKTSWVLFVALWCRLANGAEIRGVVLDSSSGEALSNVAIKVAGTALQTISDATGHFRLTEIPAGDHSLKVSTYWPVSAEFHLDAGEVKDFEVVVTPETQHRVDRVSVPARYDSLQEAPTVLSPSGNELKNLSSVSVDDPLRVVQALPGVT